MLRLRVRDVDFEDGAVLVVGKTKTKASKRRVPLKSDDGRLQRRRWYPGRYQS